MSELIKLGFLRGVNFSNSIGASDWRIGLYTPDFGFETWIFGKGDLPLIQKPGVHFISSPHYGLNIIDTLVIDFYYTLKAVQLKLDVVVCNPGAFWSGLLFKRLRPKSKFILDIRSTPIDADGLMGFIIKQNFRFLLGSKTYDAISVITTGMMEELDQKYHFIGKKPSVVWGSGYDENVFKPSDESFNSYNSSIIRNNFIVMYHGTLSMNRGLFETIRALYILKNMGIKDIRLQIIGQGMAELALRKLSEVLNVSDRVSFIPPIPYDELPRMIAIADVGIDPRPNKPFELHQSPLKMFEYLAMGKPVLATDLPCHRDISDAVILMPDNTPEQIVAAILHYREKSDDEKRRICEVAFNDVKGATWSVRAKVLADFIRLEVLKN